LSSRSEYHSSSFSIKFSNSLLVVITPDPWPDPGALRTGGPDPAAVGDLDRVFDPC
jgi:hypothetical protein